MPLLIRMSLCLLASTVAIPAMAQQGSVNADEFYRDAKELSGKGMRAMFDERTKPRMAQMRAAAETVKAENEAGKKRGNPLYCVSDAERKKGLNTEMIVQMLGRIPEVQRKRMTLAQA